MDERDSFISEHQTEFEEILKQFVALKSISVTGVGIHETVDFLQNLLKRLLDAQVEIVQTAGNPIILATLKGKSDKNILLYGHYDVMAPGDLNGWQTDPFTLTKADGRFFGRGVGDNKGQLLAQILGLYTYYQLHHSFPFNITLFIEGEEEKGSPSLAPTLQAIAQTKLKAIDAAIVVDGAFGADGTHVLRMGNRGLLAFELHTQTGTHDNHSGNLGNVMDNPFVCLLKYLDKIYDYQTGEVKIPHFYDGVVGPSAQERSWIDKLPYDRKKILAQSGINSLELDKETYYENLMFNPTFNFFSVHSGYTGQGVKTSIPHEAYLKVDCRLVGDQSIDKIKTGLKEIYHDDLLNGNLQLKYLGDVAPEHTKADPKQVEWIYEAIKQATGKAYIEPVMPGTVPNYVWKDILKVPVFTIPYANYDEHNHDFNENLQEQAFGDGIRISYELLNLAK